MTNFHDIQVRICSMDELKSKSESFLSLFRSLIKDKMVVVISFLSHSTGWLCDITDGFFMFVHYLTRFISMKKKTVYSRDIQFWKIPLLLDGHNLELKWLSLFYFKILVTYPLSSGKNGRFCDISTRIILTKKLVYFSTFCLKKKNGFFLIYGRIFLLEIFFHLIVSKKSGRFSWYLGWNF